MQTFLPYADFSRSAACLDWRRLGKQRVEVLQILRCLRGIKTGWANHPAVKMWRGHENALAVYGITVCSEWMSRGYRDGCLEQITSLIRPHTHDEALVVNPPWLGDPALHLSHQSNLLRKDHGHYTQHFPCVRPDLPYVWPV